MNTTQLRQYLAKQKPGTILTANMLAAQTDRAKPGRALQLVLRDLVANNTLKLVGVASYKVL